MLQYNYIGILSASLQEPIALMTFVDYLIPFVSWFLAPYLLWLFFPIISLLFVLHKKITTIDMVSMYITHLLLLLSCFVLYLIFPTSAESVMVDMNTLNSMTPAVGTLVHALYKGGVPYNAFPSYHVASVVFMSLFSYYNWKKFFWISLPFIIATSIATVFVKYHFFVDIFGGIAMGVIAYYVLYEKITLKNVRKLFLD